MTAGLTRSIIRAPHGRNGRRRDYWAARDAAQAGLPPGKAEGFFRHPCRRRRRIIVFQANI
jgi:hypothetical protein